MRLNKGRMRGCYQHALLRSPKLTGRADVRFVIARDGHVHSVRVTGLDDMPLMTCIARAFAAIRFAAPEGGYVSVAWPLVLSPE